MNYFINDKDIDHSSLVDIAQKASEVTFNLADIVRSSGLEEFSKYLIEIALSTYGIAEKAIIAESNIFSAEAKNFSSKQDSHFSALDAGTGKAIIASYAAAALALKAAMISIIVILTTATALEELQERLEAG